ncbi:MULTISPECIES: GTP-binding protein [unclassified Paenibacillus]|uniref:CobW family GTP-binding protein n=1 Tax=unclassified Paenibacillus TaxID=185978 RepID=UPI001AE656DC|nr:MULTISPECIES: GTP-binding protein [unclassified Paenibacillus]MBP1155624.1 G3E family GTPase [Paenibacillus sp. PvP091]MBP1168990.1 G3E family GTPase [Paenibacillus sp. PvR098]MBP2440018.1 G3E family GTPase [Paenibacillus sp. PvP052]
MKQPVSVHILSGFLGSGKTTLLTRALDYYKLQGKKPAVVMNELGDINLDGMMVDEEVPMTEMLGGCICCTIRGDLGMELRQLILDHEPDVVFVESTGAANPMEMLDGVTDASLLTEVALKSVITVVDAAQLAERSINPAGKTYRLMADQIRCATRIILNKTDLIPPSELVRTEAIIRELNPVAPIIPTVRCEIDLAMLDQLEGGGKERHLQIQACGCEGDHENTHHECGHEHEGAHHHSHEHVMVYTHYFRGPIESERFEELIGRLPHNIYRAKGILRFTDTTSPFLFQFAYREMDFIKISPKENVASVAVFIGEHFDKEALSDLLAALETR